MTAPTIGLVIALGTTEGQDALAKALQDFPNRDFHSGAQSAKENQMKFILAAGRLDRINGGIVLILAQDEPNAILGLIAANRRLAEVGASSTHWIVSGDPSFQQRAMQAAQSGDKKTTK